MRYLTADVGDRIEARALAKQEASSPMKPAKRGKAAKGEPSAKAKAAASKIWPAPQYNFPKH